MCSLPPELQDCVLDDLRGDRRALLRCALVSKSWHLRAQYNLFHTINLDWDDRERTNMLLAALSINHSLVHKLAVSSKAALEPGEFVALMEALENLESLYVHVPNATSPVLSFFVSMTGGPELGERLLSAIANMEKLRILDFVSHGTPYAWMPNMGLQPTTHVIGRGLRQLHTMDGDMFPTQRMHRLWAAITAAKAQEGAVPLTCFGTSVARNGFQPLARFLEVSGAQLQTLRLDLRAISFLRQYNTVGAFRSSGLSLLPCKNMRTLVVHLDASWRGAGSDNLSVFSALLRTASPNTPLERITITLDNLRAESFTMSGAPEAIDSLDRCMVDLPQLRHVDWQLSPSVRRAQLTVNVGGTDPLLHLLRQRLSRLVRRDELQVTCTVLNRR